MLLNNDQQLIKDIARRFAQEQLVPWAAEWDRTATFPSEHIAAMGELGLMGIIVPSKYDGGGADHVSYAVAVEEISFGSGACGMVMSGHNSVGCMPLYNYGTANQKERWLRPMARGELLSAFCLTEPQGGSEASKQQTRARKSGHEYVLNGTKQFITSGSSADIAIIFASTDPAAGAKGISAFLVPTDSPGYQVVRIEDKMGLRASDTCQIALDDVVVPATMRLGDEGQGYRIALSNLEGGRIGIAAQCIGIARAALEAAISYAKERITFGKPIFEHQAVGFRLARMATELEAARQLTLHAAALRDAGQACLKEASMAKLHASEVAEKVCSDAMQTLGGYGYLRDYPVERFYRDVRGAKIYEGTNDIQCLVIAKHLD